MKAEYGAGYHKKVKLKGETVTIWYSEGSRGIISETKRKVRRHGCLLTEHEVVSNWTYYIGDSVSKDGKEYYGTRTFRDAGYGYSETFQVDGYPQKFNSHKKVAEFILENIIH